MFVVASIIRVSVCRLVFGGVFIDFPTLTYYDSKFSSIVNAVGSPDGPKRVGHMVSVGKMCTFACGALEAFLDVKRSED